MRSPEGNGLLGKWTCNLGIEIVGPLGHIKVLENSISPSNISQNRIDPNHIKVRDYINVIVLYYLYSTYKNYTQRYSNIISYYFRCEGSTQNQFCRYWLKTRIIRWLWFTNYDHNIVNYDQWIVTNYNHESWHSYQLWKWKIYYDGMILHNYTLYLSTNYDKKISEQHYNVI